MAKKTDVLSSSVSADHITHAILVIRGQKVLLDINLAELYGVETKKINQAVKRNAPKFPEGYIIELT